MSPDETRALIISAGTMIQANIFDNIPKQLLEESFDTILSSSNVRIERILSKGHRSPESGWYDQEENEWVMVVAGEGIVLFEDGREFKLAKGDYLNIPKGVKHKVTWTDPTAITIWLAIFYG